MFKYTSYKIEVQAKLLETCKLVAEQIGMFLVAKMKALSPVGRYYGGLLRKSNDYYVKENGKGYQVEAGNTSNYGVYVEKGTGIYAEEGNGRQKEWTYKDPKTGAFVTTVGQRPQPYVHPAAMRNIPEITSLTKDLIRREMSK